MPQKIGIQHIGIVVAFGVGLGLGLLLPIHGLSHPPETTELHEGGDYGLINPLLACDAAEGHVDTEVTGVKRPVQSYIDAHLANHSIDHVAVYFRDLDNGWSFGINEKEGFIPASLLKLPIAIGFVKYSETKSNILDTKITVSEADTHKLEDVSQQFPPAQKLVANDQYSIQDLISHSLQYSDNQANALLVKNLPTKILQDVFSNLHIEGGVPESAEDTISVKVYATFFRILYNTSYLNRANSQKVLDLLTKTDFNQGLVAGVPKGVEVAHKFGESESEVTGVQLHDCGIIYDPSKPYLLCVMTRGKDMAKLATTIKDISGLVYDRVNKSLE